jgi:hypothetical protein
MDLVRLPNGAEAMRLTLREEMAWCGVPARLQEVSWASWWSLCTTHRELDAAVRPLRQALLAFERWRRVDGVWAYTLSGPPGRGKSGLAACTVARFCGWGGEHRPRWVRWAKLVAAVADSWKAGGESALLAEVTDNRLLVLDDLGAEGTRDDEAAYAWQRRIAYEVINARYERGLPTVVTTNLSQPGIDATFDPRISSRLGEGLWISLGGLPSLRVLLRGNIS